MSAIVVVIAIHRRRFALLRGVIGVTDCDRLGIATEGGDVAVWERRRRGLEE